jgi:hypothetical protein
VILKVFLAHIFLAETMAPAEGQQRRGKAPLSTTVVERVVATRGLQQQLAATGGVRGNNCGHHLEHPAKGKPQRPNLARSGIVVVRRAGNGFTMVRMRMVGLSFVLVGP